MGIASPVSLFVPSSLRLYLLSSCLRRFSSLCGLCGVGCYCCFTAYCLLFAFEFHSMPSALTLPWLRFLLHLDSTPCLRRLSSLWSVRCWMLRLTVYVTFGFYSLPSALRSAFLTLLRSPVCSV